MRNLLRLPAVSLLALSLLLGCSNDDEKEPEADASPTAEAPAPDEVKRGCQAEVEITGAAEASWSGKATVRRSENEPKAVYESSDGEASISVFSPFNDNPATANVTVDGSTFTTPLGDDTGLEVAENGSGATVDATAAGVEGDEVDIAATVECAKPKKKGGKGGN